MMKITVGIALTLIGTSLPGVFSWGGSGHQIVGMVAQNYLTPKAAAAISSILDATYSGSLGPAATWADAVKHTKGYTWSAPLHFADTNDSPPDSCGYVDTRDCPPEGCLVSAITNYTARLCNPTNSNAVKDEALKFITHFLGDITQPLHVCARDLGGNKDKATFDGKTTLNLHSVWDTSIIEKHMTNDYSGSLANYVQGLIKSIDSGEFKSLKDQWSSCVDPTAVGTTGTGNLNCAIVWAQDTNGYDCGSEVWKNFLSDTTADLGGSYYKAAVPIVDQQLAKGGYRLGLYLNNVFEGCTATPGPSTSITSTPEPTITPTPTPRISISTKTTKTKTGKIPKPTSESCAYEGDQLCLDDGVTSLYKECSNGVYVQEDCGSRYTCYQSGRYYIDCL